MSQRKVSIENYLCKTDTSIRRTHLLVPRGVRLKRFYCSTYKQIFDVCRKNYDAKNAKNKMTKMKISWKNIENSLRYALKTSKIENFRLPPVEKRSRDNFLGPVEPWIFFQN